MLPVLATLSSLASIALAQAPGTFKIVGNTCVSAQQLFLGTNTDRPGKVYILDKVQNNNITVSGHPAWVVEYDLATNQCTPMDVWTNTFCAGGNVAGDNTWVNVGGNQPVYQGGFSSSANNASNPYKDGDGGMAVRTLADCTDASCVWGSSNMTTRRWYPMLETWNDGSVIIIGGDLYGGFVNDVGNDNPTWEWWPSRGGVVPMPFLHATLPVNLYALTWLVPSGKLFMQANWQAMLFDPISLNEDYLPNITHAVRVYPASAATAMFPLTPANNWTATILFCGGVQLGEAQWTMGLDLTQIEASQSCVTISPDTDRTWNDDDDLPVGRVMANFIALPDSTFFLCNGAQYGVAGYGTETWTKGDSYADVPILQPLIFDPSKPKGSRFSSEGLQPSTIPRMYHSTATLLPDGSVFIAGSSPHPDVVLNTEYPTTYTAEIFYPWYYQKTRPQPTGMPTTIGYGGTPFDISLSAADLNGDGEAALENTTCMIIRTGFATHAINFGQRILQLENSYTLNSDGSAILHVNQLLPNPSLLAPGPALLFIVVQGVPSTGVQVMIGSGTIGPQPTAQYAVLPGKKAPTGGAANSNATQNSVDGAPSGSGAVGGVTGDVRAMGLVAAVIALATLL